MKLKRGDTKEDGMIFWSYTSRGNEWWVTKKHFQNIVKKESEKRLVRKLDPKLLEKDKVSRKVYKQKNKDKINKANQEYRRKNKEKVKTWKSNIYKLNAERHREGVKKHYKENREKINKKMNEYYKIKKKTNPFFKLKCNIRNLILQTFKTIGRRKNTKTEKILGCSFEEFKAYIESQFQDGMSWENRNIWHIDHIMPVSMAKTEDEIIRLNHHRNLRPLWAHENIAKADKTPDILVLF
jgi:hypothetical protein